jgi:hypothetical protein
MLNGASPRCETSPDGAKLCIAESSDFSLVSISVFGAKQFSAGEFERQTAAAYLAIQRAMESTDSPHPVRVWNHLPEIHAPAPDGRDRYMAFNAGRFHAYGQWLGGAGAFDRTVPTASGVGHDGPDLVIHALGSKMPGIAVANPRQIAPYRYSKRFGPLPPCFARATVLPASEAHQQRVLVGGTASIRGEESLYLGDIGRQTSETFHNLAHLVRAAMEPGVGNAPELTDQDARRWMALFRELRVYYPREADQAFIKGSVLADFSPSCRFEFIRADLCRAELLVEIEGLAEG